MVIPGKSSLRKQKLVIFLQVCQSSLMKFSLLPKPFFFYPYTKFSGMINVQRGELCSCYFIGYNINISLCADSHEPICLKLGTELDTIKLSSVISV